MLEFYKWAGENFAHFLAVTGALVVGVAILIGVWKEK